MTIDAVLGSDYDISFDESGDISTSESLDTQLKMSLFCDRRALPSEVQDPSRRRGWVGNEGTGFEVGSKIWLYRQERITRTTLLGISSEAQKCVDWMIEDGIVVDISANAVLSNGSVGVNVELKRPGSDIEYRYYKLWDNTGV